MKRQGAKRERRLHQRSKHSGKYDFDALVGVIPELKQHLILNRSGEHSIDFSNAESVKILNRSLLSFHYNIKHWDIPTNYLTPAIPGRAEYIHYMADLLNASNFGRIPNGKNIICLDIGVGANLIYPIIGISDYNWSFIGSDIDQISLKTAKQIADANESLVGKIDLRYQEDSSKILTNILLPDDKIDLSFCNPPFHESAEAARNAANRKVGNLTGKKTKNAALNFLGQSNELWCKGGERQFIKNYIVESKKFARQCFWYSTLVSKKTNLKGIYAELENRKATKHHTIPLGIGNKSSHIVTWTFLNPEEQKEWRKRWV